MTYKHSIGYVILLRTPQAEDIGDSDRHPISIRKHLMHFQKLVEVHKKGNEVSCIFLMMRPIDKEISR